MRMLLVCLFVMLSGGASTAFGAPSYHGCVDAAGRPVVSAADPFATAVARSAFEAGRPAILYNPGLLPRLSDSARLFFYAHECARHHLGLPLERRLTVEEARRADCHGLDGLLRSGLLGADALVVLQAELRFDAGEWGVLPGPPRGFDLLGCRRASVLVVPPGGREQWNACARVCADTLRWCRGPDCEAAYDRCAALCDHR